MGASCVPSALACHPQRVSGRIQPQQQQEQHPGRDSSPASWPTRCYQLTQSVSDVPPCLLHRAALHDARHGCQTAAARPYSMACH
jgi:hypothetical protein